MAYERSKIMIGREITLGPEYIHAYSRTAGEVPGETDLKDGELAVNLADKIIYGKNSSGQVVSYSESDWGTSVFALSFAATVNTDASAADIFDLTLTGNVILANPTNPVNGKTIRWRISQDGSGNRTVTLGNKFNIPSSGSDPLPWSTAADACDILAATYHAGRDQWDVVAFVPGY